MEAELPTVSCDIFSEDLVQTRAGPVSTTPSLWALMSFDHADLEGCVFFVFSISSASNILSAFSSMGFPELSGERFDGDNSCRVECSKVSA